MNEIALLTDVRASVLLLVHDFPSVVVGDRVLLPRMLRLIWEPSFSSDCRWKLIAADTSRGDYARRLEVTSADFGHGPVPGWITDLITKHTPATLDLWKD